VPAILAGELEGFLFVAEGKVEQGLIVLWQAAGIEDSLPVEFGPPDVVKPTHELLGEVLLGLKRPREAQRQFQRALDLAPRRALALLGLWRAATAAGDQPQAARALAELRNVWKAADQDLVWHREVSTAR
jgi:tetratricopeptide (TPR) repeat protein